MEHSNGSSNHATASSASSPPSSSSSSLPYVEVHLSRRAYPLGGSVVGTVLIRQPSRDNSKKEAAEEPERQPLRSLLSNVVVYVAGFCKIDPRWHNVAEYSKIYGKVHPFLQLLYSNFDPELLQQPNGDETVCFWATDGLELLELTERTEGKWERVGNDDDDDEVLAFTFRVDIPSDLPHSINATTCRYFYTADVLIKSSPQQQQRILKNPFLVCTNPQHEPREQQQQKDKVISSRVKFGTCSGMAHSIGLPCHLSATEVNRPRGQMTVALQRPQNLKEQTLRVSNALGQPACVMTVVGATKLTPGSRLHLQWDFPETMSRGWIPCHQVSACLMGEEFAVYEDGKKTRTQSYVFDTCHEWVDPGVTHRVSKSLLLAMTAPCNLYSDVMESSIRCQVDITVKENGEYNNLRIELPCNVVHAFETFDEDIYEQEENQMQPLSEMLGLGLSADAGDGSMSTEGILHDLKSLALQMERSLKQPIKMP
jgi:hypothetical protein